MKSAIKTLFLLYFSTQAIIAMAQDTTPPVISAVTVTPETVTPGDSVTVTITITDDISGVMGQGFPGGVHVTTADPTEGRILHENNWPLLFLYKWKHIGGNNYESKAFVPAAAANGTWSVAYIQATDQAGNSRYYQNCTDYLAIFKIGNISDVTAPKLTSVSIPESSVAPGDSITIRLSLTDISSYVNGIGLPGYLSSHSSTSVTISDHNNVQQITVNKWKTAPGCYYEARVKIPADANQGTWKLENIVAYDRSGNSKTYQNGEDYIETFEVSNTTTDITDLTTSEKLTIFPNPAGKENVLTVKGNNISKIIVTDLLSTKISETDYNNESEISLPLSIYESGLYIIQVTQGQETVKEKLVISD